MKLKPPSPGDLGDRIRETEVWKSIFRPGSIFRKGYKDTSRDRLQLLERENHRHVAGGHTVSACDVGTSAIVREPPLEPSGSRA